MSLYYFGYQRFHEILNTVKLNDVWSNSRTTLLFEIRYLRHAVRCFAILIDKRDDGLHDINEFAR